MLINLPLFICALLASQLVCLWIGKQSARGVSGQDDYFLAKRTVRFFPLMMTFLATQIGGGLVLGAADEAYHYGWSVLFYPLGAALGLILLGLGVGKKLYQLNLGTIAEIFEVKYRSSILRKVAAALSILSLFMIFVAQIIASKKFIIALGLNSSLFFNLFWAIVILYTAIGGLKAVIATDIVQALAFIAVFIVCLFFALYNVPIKIEQVISDGMLLSSSQGDVLKSTKLFGWIFMPLLFMLIEQDMGQRCFAADSYKTVVKSTAVSAFCILAFSCIPIFFGILAKSLGLTISHNESILMSVVQLTSNPYCSALFACGILLVIISTADALINAIASNLSLDFPFFRTKGLRVAQVMTIAIALSGLLCSYYFKNIVDVLIQSYELSVSCLLVPIIMALFKKKNPVLPALSSILCGALGFVLFRFVSTPLPKEFLSICLSFVGFMIGSFATRPSYDTISTQ
jgi:solute:Na+ symporter, SSS family